MDAQLTFSFYSFKLELTMKEQIRNKLCNEYPKKPMKDIDPILEFIEKSLNPKYSHLLTICRPVNAVAEVDIAILRALLKSEKENTQRSKNKIDPAVAQLRLALEWNRIDMAQKYIFTEDLKDQVKSTYSLSLKDSSIIFHVIFSKIKRSIRLEI
jgi:hypothetical protein